MYCPGLSASILDRELRNSSIYLVSGTDGGRQICVSFYFPGKFFMKGVRIHEFGGPEVLRYEGIPDAQPRKDQVLIRVKACALNHLDIWVRKGLPGVKLPHILGSDIAGEIVAVGEYVTAFNVGQRVLLAPMHFCNH